MGPRRAADEALTGFVQVRARYRRAMNLERDSGRPDALAGYLVTPIVRRALTRIASSLIRSGPERAWSLTRPYGSGKTAFAVFLASLVGKEPAPRLGAQRLLRDADPQLSHSLRKTSFVPVILTGERAPLDLLLVKALRASLEAEWSTRRGPRPTIFSEIARLADRLAEARNVCVTSEIVECFERARRLVASTFGSGLLLVVDEAGKILEYAAQNPGRGDVQLFQALAEVAAGSGDKPLIIVAVRVACRPYSSARRCSGCRTRCLATLGVSTATSGSPASRT
jgi:hypothetical protein